MQRSFPMELQSGHDFYQWREAIEYQMEFDNSFDKNAMMLSITGRARAMVKLYKVDTSKSITEILNDLEAIFIGQETMLDQFLAIKTANAEWPGAEKFLLETTPIIRSLFFLPAGSAQSTEACLEHIQKLATAFYVSQLPDDVRASFPIISNFEEAMDAVTKIDKPGKSNHYANYHNYHQKDCRNTYNNHNGPNQYGKNGGQQRSNFRNHNGQPNNNEGQYGHNR